MIGQLINKFDALPEEKCNVGTFNEMFKADIGTDLSVKVEIGEILTGGLRSVTIGSKTVRIAIRDIKPNLKGTTQFIEEFRYDLFDEGVLVGTYTEKNIIAEFLGKSVTTVNNMITKGYVCDEIYTLKATKTGERLKKFIKDANTIKTFKPVDNSRQFGRNYYIIKKDGIEICCNSVADCVVIMKTSALKFGQIYKTGKSLYGYTIAKHRMTDVEVDIKAAYRKKIQDLSPRVEPPRKRRISKNTTKRNNHKGAKAKYTWSVKVEDGIKLFRATSDLAKFINRTRQCLTMNFKEDCTKEINGYSITRMTIEIGY